MAQPAQILLGGMKYYLILKINNVTLLEYFFLSNLTSENQSDLKKQDLNKTCFVEKMFNWTVNAKKRKVWKLYEILI